MNKRILTILVVACAIIGAVLIFYPGSDKAQGADVSGSDLNQPTTPEISKNVTGVDDHKQQNAKRFATVLSNVMSRPEPERTDANELSMKKLHQKTGPYYADMAPEVLEKMLQREKPNIEWTSSVTKEAQKVLAYEESQGTTLYKTDCRETLCKIQFDHENLDRHKSFMDGRMDLGPWMAGAGTAFGSYKEQDGDKLRSFIYFTKPDDKETFLAMRREMATILDSE